MAPSPLGSAELEINALILAAVIQPPHPYEIRPAKGFPYGKPPDDPPPDKIARRLARAIKANRLRVSSALRDLKIAIERISTPFERQWLWTAGDELDRQLTGTLALFEERLNQHMAIRARLGRGKKVRPGKKSAGGRPRKDDRLARVVMLLHRKYGYSQRAAAEFVTVRALMYSRRHKKPLMRNQHNRPKARLEQQLRTAARKLIALT